MDVHVFELHGEFDISQKAKIESCLARIDASGRTVATILDLSDVRYLDTTFINALFGVRRRLARERPGYRIVLVAPKTNIVWRLYEIAGLADVFPLYETLELARRDSQLAGTKSHVHVERTNAWPSFTIDVLSAFGSPEDRRA